LVCGRIAWHARIVSPDHPVVRVAHVDDHETVRLGLAAMLSAEPSLELVASVATVEPLVGAEVDVVLLDLRLSDGSAVESNVERLTESGLRVLAFTAGEDQVAVRAAARAGVLGIIRKSDSRQAVVDAIQRAALGESIATTEWAAAIDGDPQLAAVRLSPKEQQVLALYAAGEKSVAVANSTGLSVNTVAEYVKRIRQKYAAAGRPAATKVDLYRRALEDGILEQP
jgi:two-component system, NarL family, response regulator DevR